MSSHEPYSGDRDRRLLYTSAGIAALTLALRLLFSLLKKDLSLVGELDKVGRRVREKGREKVGEGEEEEEANEEDMQYDEYDVIIAGGGTAGCVLASRLSEDINLRILLLEAGGSGKALVASRTPAAFPTLYHTPHVYELRTTPQDNLGGRTCYWPRGKLLGGCSSINAQMAQYGAPSDFDEWASIIGDDSWAWESFRKYITKFESVSPLVDPRERGVDGPVRIGYNNHAAPPAHAFVRACERVGIPFSADFNTAKGTRGVNRIMTYINDKGERVSTESAYFTPDVLARPNLTVATHARVTRIVFDTSGAVPCAAAVEFAASEKGPRFSARARKEVVVCGGAVHSPHILMLSGVGPAVHLQEHSIPVVHNLPGVGANLVDHPQVDLRFADLSKNSTNFLRPRNVVGRLRLAWATLQYLVVGKGPLASNMGEAAAFFRADDPRLFPPSDYPAPLEDSNSGPDAPDIEIVTTPIAAKEHEIPVCPDMHTFGMHVILLRPTSTGTVGLKSANPFQQPSLDPNYCQTEHDVECLVRGLRAALKIAATEPLDAVLDNTSTHPELDHGLVRRPRRDALEAVVRARADTIYHPASTCRMAPLAQGGVVDSLLRVYGIPNLRVCDASVFPLLVSGHPTGAIIASAEKLADIIKEEYAII